MPGPELLTRACLSAALASALVTGLSVLVAARLGRGRSREARTAWFNVGWSLGVAAGFYPGCGMIGVFPRWPPLEDLDRLLVFIVPGAIICDLIAAAPIVVPDWLAWAARLAAAGCVTPILLHGSVYLSDVAGPETARWTPIQSVLVPGLIGAAMVIEWALLVPLARRSRGPSSSPGLVLAVAIAGAGAAVVLSGYATGGMVGPVISAAAAGATFIAGAIARGDRPEIRAMPGLPIGFLIAGHSGLLIIGRFFGELRSVHAIVLFLAPLTAWATEAPGVRRLSEGPRGTARVLLVALVVLGVVADASHRGPLGP